jgi:hypothetical protein
VQCSGKADVCMGLAPLEWSCYCTHVVAFEICYTHQSKRLSFVPFTSFTMCYFVTIWVLWRMVSMVKYYFEFESGFPKFVWWMLMHLCLNIFIYKLVQWQSSQTCWFWRNKQSQQMGYHGKWCPPRFLFVSKWTSGTDKWGMILAFSLFSPL